MHVTAGPESASETRQVERGCHTTLRSVPPGPVWLFVVSHVSEQSETGRTLSLPQRT